MERLRPLASRTALAPVPSVLGDPLAPAEPMAGTIHVSAGIDSEWLPLAGQAVGEVRRRIASRFGLHSEASAYVGQQRVGDDVVVRPGEHLSFVHHSGEKGARCVRAASQPLQRPGSPAGGRS